MTAYWFNFHLDTHTRAPTQYARRTRLKGTATHLVCAERVGQHVAAAGSKHVHLLTHVILQLLKLALGPSNLGLDLETHRHTQFNDQTSRTNTETCLSLSKALNC